MFDETTTSLGGTVTHPNLFNLSLDQGDLLPEGYVEERVQVDRRRLEAMITGMDKSLPSAEEFFETVESQSGAHIHWPSRLKIGAKTKKDPFVKIIGEASNVKVAKSLILHLLKVKKDRITLKIEIPHSSHSHIIGRKGKNTQDVMQATQCHIHFPDSNKHSDAEKNNQVSVAGPTYQVERARSRLRQISPVIITITASVLDHQRPDLLKRVVSSTDVSVNAQQLPNGQFQWTLKASESNELGICMAIERIKQVAGLGDECDFHCRSNFELRPALLNNSYGLFNLNTIRWIAFHTNTQMQFSPQGTCVVVLGQAQRILQARKYLMGLLPASLQFDRLSEKTIDRSLIRQIEEKFEVQVVEKSKLGTSLSASSFGLSSGIESAFVIRTHEANLHKAYQARKFLLKGTEEMMLDEEDLIPNEYAFMETFFEQTKQPKGFHTSSNQPLSSLPPPLLVQGQFLASSPNDSFGRDAPDSPDPEESPIAHSLLASARSLKISKGDLWRTPGLERQMNRDRFRPNLIGTAGTHENSSGKYGHGESNLQREDLWSSGIGFSSSLPADLLKPRLATLRELGWGKNEENEENLKESPQGEQRESNFKADFLGQIPDSSSSFLGQQNLLVQQDSPSNLLISSNSSNLSNFLAQSSGPDTSLKQPKVLASVREEEEYSDYNQSNSSNLSSPLNRTAASQQNNLSQKKNSMSNSLATNFFDTSFGSSETTLWDIRNFTDPAMVLSQLGCSEYLPHFREQEIDMPAFLLLDEQNLKDIGVAKMGTRKKINNAIMRLRESALTYGYRL